VLLVNRRHECSGRREDLIDEDEDGLLGRKLDALADHVDELAHGQVGRDQVLLLIDGRDVRLLNLLADDLNGREASVMVFRRCDGCKARIVTHRDAVGVLLPDALGLGLALLERVLVLELGAHGSGVVLMGGVGLRFPSWRMCVGRRSKVVDVCVSVSVGGRVLGADKVSCRQRRGEGGLSSGEAKLHKRAPCAQSINQLMNLSE